MSSSVIFYRLTKKFVDSAESVPDDAKDVLYYTLAVGHHTGIIDCFENTLELPLESYERIVSLVENEDARFKLEGIMRFGEIEIDKSHVPVLLPALRTAFARLDAFDTRGHTSIKLSSEEVIWLSQMLDLVVKVKDETNMYLMVRRVDS